MKRKSILFLIMIFSISLLGCSDTKETNKNKIPRSIDSVELTSPPYKVPFVLTDKTYFSSPFVFKDNTLIFTNYNDKDRISLYDKELPNEYIKTEDIKEFYYDYRTSSLALLNNTIYFSDYSDSYCLASYNMDNKEYTKLYNAKVDTITIVDNNIYFINKDDGYTLYRYNIQDKKTKKITPHKVGKYIINGNHILYQNIDKNSKLYSITLDGEDNSAISEFPTDSFVVYNGVIIAVNSHDDYTPYIIQPSDLSFKRISLDKIKDLKAFNNQIYYLDRDKSNLHSLTYDLTTEEVTTTNIFSEGVNDYYPTEKAIFIKKAANINNNYVYIVKLQ